MKAIHESELCRCRTMAVALCSLLFLVPPAWAAVTYYVDASLGNDTRDGLSEATAWKTIAKVNASIFQPGDAVLFKCGEVWREQLAIPGSGTVGSPITFGQYGVGCTATVKPVISGSDPVPALGWTQFSGNIYSTSLQVFKAPLNKITNDTFDFDPTLSWSSWSQDAQQQIGWPTSCATGRCLQFTASPSYSSLVSSNRFSIEQGKSYTVKFSIAAGLANQNVTVIARRSGQTLDTNGKPDYSSVGFQQALVVGTVWQNYSYTFTAISSENDNARIDFYVDSGQTMYIDNVSVTNVALDKNNQPVPLESTVVRQVFVDGIPVDIAHHPNRGYLPQKPTSVYLSIGQDQPGSVCPRSGGAGTNTFTAGSDLVLTSVQQQDLAGAGIHIRINDWLMNDRTVTAYDAGTRTFTFDSATNYNLCSGWGYFLDNKLWMLDSPGEWFYDATAQQLYLWMPDSSNPGSRVEVGYRDYGIYGRRRLAATVDGLAIQRANTGVDVARSANFVIRNTDISNSVLNGISADYSSDAVVDSCTIDQSAHNGIQMTQSYRFAITNNVVSNTAVRLDNGVIASLPLSSGRGMLLGGATGAGGTNPVTITGNMVSNSAYNGIQFGNAISTLQNNVVENSCLVLDDCGAVYTGGESYNSQIVGNILVNSYGNADGRPASVRSAAQGLYLDDLTEHAIVTGNTVINADNTGQMHRGSNNTLQGNTFYGARRSAIWFQEDNHNGGGQTGAILNNSISGNILFPASNTPPVRFDSNFGDIAGSGTGNLFDSNLYSGLYTDRVVADNFASPSATNLLYTLTQWQALGQDTGVSLFQPVMIRPFHIASINSASIAANGGFDTDTSSWTSWSADNGQKLSWQPNCSINGGCLKFVTSDAAGGILLNYAFAIDQAKTYLLEFRISSDADNVNLDAVFRRNASPWENATAVHFFTANVAPQRLAFLYTPTETLSNARLDFDVPAGQVVYLDNVSIREVAPEYHSDFSADSRIIVNKGSTTQVFGCPDTDMARCNTYIDLNGNPVVWPITLDGYSSKIVVWSANPFKDMDGDWITDDRDSCPGSRNVAAVDISGCAPTDVSFNISAANSVPLGSSITYGIGINNNGPDQAGSVTATLSLASGLIPTSATASQGSCTLNSGSVSCSLGLINSGGTVNISVTSTATTTGTLTASGTVAGAGVDTNTANNTATFTITVVAPDLTPTAMSARKSGSTVYVSDTITNQGTGDAGPFTIGYYLSKDTTYSSDDLPLLTATGSNCTRSISTSLAKGTSNINPGFYCYKNGNVTSGQRYYVLVVDDATKQVIESNENNNVLAGSGQVWW